MLVVADLDSVPVINGQVGWGWHDNNDISYDIVSGIGLGL